MLVNIRSDVPFPSFKSVILSPINVVNTDPSVNKTTVDITH